MLSFWSAVALAATAADRPCDGTGPLVHTAACDPSLTPDQRAQYIVSRLTQAEKISLMDDTADSVPSLGIGGYEWWSEGLHGVAGSRGVSFAAPTLYATSFPQVITTSASFNKTLFERIGHTVGKEARAFYNAGHAGLTFWTPNINLIRDPRWGRGHETPGEDPIHTANYAEAFVPGLQRGGNSFVKAGACCKHYYGYDMENSGGTDRHHFNAIITFQDEADTYLPAFHSCVYNGRAIGVMCSYNSVNGVPSCANGRIMNDIARGQWNFSGYITSDCNAVLDIPENHQYLPANLTSAAVLNAGMDSDCGAFLGRNLAANLGNGTVSIESVNTALQHLFAVQVRLGMFDSKESQTEYFNYTWAADVNTPEHQKLALEAAEQGLVLLKNTDHTFPLSLSSISSLAVIGPNANATEVMQGNYHGTAPYLVSPLAGLKKRVPNTVYELGCDVDCASTAGFSAATAAAAKADATVLVIGISISVEAEGRDRRDIALPGNQTELIAAVAQATNGKPLLVVVMAGGSVDFSIAKDSANVQGIMWVGYPGQSGGDALANAVFGEVNPSGRLPHTQYYANYTDNLDMLDMNWRANGIPGFPGRSYRFFSGPVVYPFGHGMSYTTYTYTPGPSPAPVTVAAINAAIEEEAQYAAYSPRFDSPIIANVTVSVKNTGTMPGAHSVLCYAHPPGADGSYQKAGMPIKYLVGTEKFHLEPSASQDLVFPLPVHALSVVWRNGLRQPVLGNWLFSFSHDTHNVTVTVTN